MNWSTVLGITFLLLIIAFSLVRADRRRRGPVLAGIVLPGGLLLLLYAWFYSRWPELGLGLLATALAVGAWWAVYGRRLPPPTSDHIKVWGQDTARPAPTDADELEAEIRRLDDEKRRMEEQLKRLKAKRNGQ